MRLLAYGICQLTPTLHLCQFWMQAGLFGMDINKKGSREGEKKVPESLGLASGVVFLVRHHRPAPLSVAACVYLLGTPNACPLPVLVTACVNVPQRWLMALDVAPPRAPLDPRCLLQICIVLFQQLHYYDIPSLVHRYAQSGRAHPL